MAVHDSEALRCFREKTSTILSMGKRNEDEVGEVDCSVILLHKVKRGGVTINKTNESYLTLIFLGILRKISLLRIPGTAKIFLSRYLQIRYEFWSPFPACNDLKMFIFGSTRFL